MIPVFKPNYGQEEIDAVTEVLKSGWIGLGPKTKQFEEEFAKYIGSSYAIGLNSATSALQLAIKVLGIGDGDEVITTPMTFVSTNMAILYNGAKPVFCDIEPDTMNIDASKIEALVTPRTKAIMVVHYGGYACDMENIFRIASNHGLHIIEDVAHGCGGKWKDARLGSMGILSCFSFHAVKNLATGDGGMITTNQSDLYKRLLKLRWLGITKDTYSRNATSYDWQYDVEELGYKMHMNDITASLGIVQLKRLEESNKRREDVTNVYNARLNGISEIQIPTRKEYQVPAFHNYVIKCEDRDALHKYLKAFEISTGVHYIPNNHYNLFKDCGVTPVAEEVFKKILTLPLYPDLQFEQVEFIAQKVKSFYR